MNIQFYSSGHLLMFHSVPREKNSMKYVVGSSKYGDVVIRRTVTEKDIKQQQFWAIVASIN